MKFNNVLIYLFIISGFYSYAQNNSLDFDGSNDAVYVSNFTKSSTYFTIEAWVYADTRESWGTIVKNWSNTSEGQFHLGLHDNSGYIDCYITQSDGTQINIGESTTTFPTGVWQHVAVVADGSYLHLYRNGIEVATKVSYDGTLRTSLNLLSIGAKLNSDGTYTSGTYSGEWNGKIDEVRIWNISRTQAQIKANMYKNLNESETGLQLYFKFDETTGSTLTDASGHYNGSLVNMDNSDWIPSAAFYGPKYCLSFDGSNDYVDCGNEASVRISGSNISLEAWIYVSSFAANSYQNTIIGMHYGVSGQSDGYVLRVGGAGIAELVLGDGVNWQSVASPDNTLTTNKWYHIAGTYDGSVMKLYVNGVLVSSNTQSFSISENTVTNLYLGECDCFPGRYFCGKMDEVRIWNDARTVKEIRENMFTTLNGSESNLVAYYNFDNTSTTTLQDFTSNANDGTLTNMSSSDWGSSSAFNTWLNTSSTTWNSSQNWSRVQIPTTNENVGLFNYSGGSSPIISNSPEFNNLFIGTSSNVNVNTDFTVNGNFYIYDDVDIKTYTATLGSNAMLYESDGIVSASTGMLTTTRDLSSLSSENVAGLGATITTSSSLGNTTIERHHEANGGEIKRYYVINPTNNSSLNATLVFQYDDTELNGNTEADIVLYKSEDEGMTWSNVGGIVNTTDNTLTLSGIDDFSWWVASDGTRPLAIELINFYGYNKDDKNYIMWTSESEINNDKYIIERSIDGINYYVINETKAVGNSNKINNYKYIDNNIKDNTIYYYKLKDVDFNGYIQEHKIISIKTIKQNISDSFNIKVYPNPCNKIINIYSSNADVNSVIIKDYLGRIIYKKTEIYSDLFSINIENIDVGLYLLIIETETENKAIKILKN